MSRQTESFITTHMSQRTQNVDIHCAKEVSGFANFRAELGQFLASNVVNEMRVMMSGKRTSQTKFLI